jgi:hypothetical protein
MAFIGFFDNDDFIINYDAPLFECRRKIKAYKRKASVTRFGGKYQQTSNTTMATVRTKQTSTTVGKWQT